MKNYIREVFMKNFEVNKILTKAEFTVYDLWFDYIIKKCECQIDGIIFLNTSSENCLKRC